MEEFEMKKIVKNVIAFVMSFAMVICLSSPAVRAEEVSMQDDGIALQSIVIGQQYFVQDKRTKLMAMFSNANTLVIKCKNLTENDRYVEMDVSTSSKSFKQRTFTVNGYKINKTNGKTTYYSHSETYGINAASAGKITIIVYPHVNTSPSSGYIDSLKGILQ